MLTGRRNGFRQCRWALRIASVVAGVVAGPVANAVAEAPEPPLMTIVPENGPVVVGRFQTAAANGLADDSPHNVSHPATGPLSHMTIRREADGHPVPLSDILRLEFSSRTPETDPGHWQRIIRLPTGESFTGRIEAVHPGDGTIALRFAGQSLRVPETALETVELMPGMRDIPLLPVQSRPGSAVFELPDANDSFLVTGRLQIRDRPANNDRREILTVLFQRAGRAQALRVFQRAQHLECDVSNGVRLWKQTVPLRDASSIAFRMEQHSGFTMEFNQTVLAQIDSPGPLQLQSLQFSNADILDAPIHARMKDRSPPARLLRAGSSTDQDRLLLNDGLEFYGRGLTFLASGVRMEGPPVMQLSWAEVQSARRARQSLAGIIARGWPVRIVLNPDRSGPGCEPEPHWLRGMLSAAHDDGIVMEHSLLGRLIIPWALIRRMESEGDSADTSRLLLESAVRHVGTAIRPEFQRVEPDGSAWDRSFELPADCPLLQPHHALFLTLDVAELEPSHPDTLQASPYLSDLRAGFLVSEVIINGSRAGTLNQHLRFHHRAGDFQRLRLRLPSGCLRPGLNTLKIQQQPGRDSRDSFDDGEWRGLALESQPAPAAEADTR